MTPWHPDRMSDDASVHAGLRAWVRGRLAEEAAVELLVRTGFARPDHPWVRHGGVEPGWWVKWEALRDTLENTGYLSEGEHRILDLAASLAGVTPQGFDLGRAVSGLDRDYLQLVLAAVAHAGGSHEHRAFELVRAADGALVPAETGDPLPPLVAWPAAEDDVVA